MLQVSLVGTDLVIVNVSQSDAGTYTCELDTDDITPLAVSHVLQILGKIMNCNCFSLDFKFPYIVLLI